MEISKKKSLWFCLIMSCLMALSMFAGISLTAVNAENEHPGLAFYLIDNSEAYAVCSSGEALSEIMIPAEYNGKPVREIMDSGFMFMEGLTLVEIPESVVRIGSYAFSDCAALSEVYFMTDAQNGKGVQEIGDGAFAYCGLRDLILPASVTVEGMGAGVFEGNPDDGSLYIRRSSAPASWLSIADTYFGEIVYGESNIVFKEEKSADGQDYAYSVQKCQNISAAPQGVLTVPCHYNGLPVINIMGRAFNNVGLIALDLQTQCSHGLTAPETVNVESTAFMNAKIENIVLNDAVAFSAKLSQPTAAAINVFANSAAKRITLPGNLTVIGQSMFTGCKELKEIITSGGQSNQLPNSLTRIDSTAFKDCFSMGKNADGSITPLQVPNTVTEIGQNVFAGWTAEQIIRFDFESLPAAWQSINWNGGNAQIKFQKAHIIFDANNDEVEDYNFSLDVLRTSTLGQIIENILEPIGISKNFTGKWYTDRACQNEFLSSRQLSEDITLYAGWEIKAVSVIFPSNEYLVFNVVESAFVVKEGEDYKVEHGGTLQFTITKNIAYTQSEPIIKANGVTILPSAGVYTLTNIQETQTITVNPMAKNSYAINLVANEFLTYHYDGENKVFYGENFSFSVTVNAQYNQSSPILRMGETILTANSGIYTISNISEAKIITVEMMPLNTYTVNFEKNPFVVFNNITDTVSYNDNLSFTLSVNSAYDQNTPIVKVNGLQTEPINGVYTILQIKRNQTISVMPMALNIYSLNFVTNQYITFHYSSANVEHGGATSFTVTVNSPYSQSLPTIKTNNLEIASVNGVYKISNIIENQNITVESMNLNQYLLTFVQNDFVSYSSSTVNVAYNGSFEFSVNVNEFYNFSSPVIRVNGIAIQQGTNGFYKITSIQSNLTITVDPMEMNTYQIYYENVKSSNWDNPKSYRPSDSITLFDLSNYDIYKFAGWYQDSALTIPCNTIQQGETGHKTFYAKYNKLCYLDIRSNHGESYFVEFFAGITFNLPTYVKPGYKGYYIIGEDEYAFGQEYINYYDKNITLYWTSLSIVETNFRIYNKDQFSEFASLTRRGLYRNQTVYLESDISVGYASIVGFSGKFYGQNHTINYSGINEIFDSSTTTFNNGLFDVIEAGGLVCDLKIANVIINLRGDAFVFPICNIGGIAGIVRGQIKNCHVEYFSLPCQIVNGMVGGIAGSAEGNAIIQDCSVKIRSGNRALIWCYFGGIVGNVDRNALIQNCTFEGRIEVYQHLERTPHVGGIAAENMGTIKNCKVIAQIAYVTPERKNDVDVYPVIGKLIGVNYGTYANCITSAAAIDKGTLHSFRYGFLWVNEHNQAGRCGGDVGLQT